MFSPNLVYKGVIFVVADVVGRCFFWSRCPLAVIYDSERYFDMSFSVSPGYVAKYPSLIAWIRVRLVGQQMI